MAPALFYERCFMTNDNASQYLRQMLSVSGINYDNPDTVIHVAIPAGISSFWGMHNWKFKGATYTLTVEGTADTYELPKNFSSIISVRETTSTNGRPVTRLTKEDFDARVPKPSASSSGTPQIYCIFMAGDKSVISFYPQPRAGDVVEFQYYRLAPATFDGLPQDYVGVALMFASAFCASPGDRVTLYGAAVMAADRLKQTDHLFTGVATEMRDETEEYSTSQKGEPPWLKD